MHFDYLVSIEGLIVKDLPLLGLTLIEVCFLLSDLFGTNNVLNPVFEFDEDFTGTRFTHKSGGTAFTELNLHLVVLVSVVADVRCIVTLENFQHLGSFFESSPKLTKHFRGIKSRVIDNNKVGSFGLLLTSELRFLLCVPFNKT